MELFSALRPLAISLNGAGLSAAPPGNTHKHAHLDHAAVDKSALKGGRLRHGEHEVFVRNERGKEGSDQFLQHVGAVSGCSWLTPPLPPVFLVINPFYTRKLGQSF